MDGNIGQHLLLLVIIVTEEQVQAVCSEIPSELHDIAEDGNPCDILDSLPCVHPPCGTRCDCRIESVIDELLGHVCDALFPVSLVHPSLEIPCSIGNLPCVSHRGVTEDREHCGGIAPVHLHRREEGILVGLLGLVVGDGGILLGSPVGNLVTITHVLVLPVLGLVDGIGSDGYCQGINERIRRHTHTGGILHQSAMPVLAGRQDVVSGLTG